MNFSYVKVDILLSTYNGEKYLDQLIDSIINQSYRDWRLLIRDDNSSDKTLSIINKYIKENPQKIFLIVDTFGNIGSTKSFEELLINSNSEYIMFCDQDDLWLENKIEITISKMIELESINSTHIPLLIFTDLIVVDSDLNVLFDSFWENQKLDVSVVSDINKLLALNVITGCTVMINKISKKYILPFPSVKVIHDYWIGINIAFYGKIYFINQKTILYRQHNLNSIGAHRVGMEYFYKKTLRSINIFRGYFKLFKELSFNVSFCRFVYYKLFFSFKRIL